jgi:hypothetical protein
MRGAVPLLRIGPAAARLGMVWLVLMVACAPTEQAPAQEAAPEDPAVTTAPAHRDEPSDAPAEPVRPRVPAVAPDSIPPGFYGPDNIRHGSTCLSGEMLRGILVVVFQEGATQAERQAAVDLVNGEVVAGLNPHDGREGSYYIRVEDDPDGEILCAAARRLTGLPQIRRAHEVIFMGPG